MGTPARSKKGRQKFNHSSTLMVNEFFEGYSTSLFMYLFSFSYQAADGFFWNLGSPSIMLNRPKNPSFVYLSKILLWLILPILGSRAFFCLSSFFSSLRLCFCRCCKALSEADLVRAKVSCNTTGSCGSIIPSRVGIDIECFSAFALFFAVLSFSLLTYFNRACLSSSRMAVSLRPCSSFLLL